MRSKRIAVLVAAGVATTLLAAAPASAGDGPPNLELDVTPVSGPVGTVVTVSGSGCDDPGAWVDFGLADFTDFAEVAVETVTPNEDGTWSGTFTVPEGVDPAHEFGVGGACVIEVEEDGPLTVATYGPVDFDVTGDGPVPTVPEPTTPTTAPGEDPEVPTPPPATPVVDDPDFTG